MQNHHLRQDIAGLQLHVANAQEKLARRSHELNLVQCKVKIMVGLCGTWPRKIPMEALALLYAYLVPIDRWQAYPPMCALPTDALLPYDPLHFMRVYFDNLFYINVPERQERTRLDILRVQFRDSLQLLDRQHAQMDVMHYRYESKFKTLCWVLGFCGCRTWP